MFHWVNFLSYAIVTAITPGPNNIMSMSNASRVGIRKFLPFNLGIWVGCFGLMLLCTLFCSTLSTVIPIIKLPIRIVGALYMLWLAWKTFKSTGIAEKSAAKNSFFSAIALQFLNPKLYIYGVVSVEAYILPVYAGQWGMLALFAFVLSVISFIATVCWALFGSMFQLLFSKYAKITNTVMALLLVYCAVSLFLA